MKENKLFSCGTPCSSIRTSSQSSNSTVIFSLKKSYEQAMRRDDVRAIVLTGARGKFSGGADINSFGSGKKEAKIGSMSVDFVTDIIEGARKPSVAAVDGLALGGRLEIAMIVVMVMVHGYDNGLVLPPKVVSV
ncbi:peroxisomal fatty acid beta-oxidation multifunctional protein MFP2-like isoform X2 [Iris pallida]|uniref:Peroxisomal fatty acid beta-oxidation multifunctional protein MFP2-like isoform X2 n=1 Tax=Iris pallida TaxID=29817 RepID=A0AAX6IM92_IRIPA|nr:peroxisomal fatty acid beta-oxidation multifunctional protein MFP2-like isoform X2 [Iris pallida]